MARKGRYTELLKTMKGKRTEVRLKKGQKLEHERRYIYGQAERLGVKIAVHKENDTLLAIVPGGSNGTSRKPKARTKAKKAKG